MSEIPFGEENPFRELPDANPYAAPTAISDSDNLSNPVLIPGIALLILSSLFLLLLIISLPGQFIDISQIDTSTPDGLGELTGRIMSLIAWLAMTTAVVFGSICMIRMKGFGFALTAAVCAAIPCCSPFFVAGIPFGIWALIMLFRPGVRERFLSTTRP